MPKPEPNTHFLKSGWDLISGTHRFSHEAMAATFEVIISHEDARYARHAAQAAFDELDRLEGELSRFIENSDISRVNNLTAGQSLTVGVDTFDCLRLCGKMHSETNGAFDITVGSLFDCWLNEDKILRTPSEEELSLAHQRTGMHLLRLDEVEHTVQLLAEGVQIDLGGIGKGYAIDRMGHLLRDWGIGTAMLHGGYSSVLALGTPTGTEGWPLALSNPDNRSEALARLCLQDRAMSGSGLQTGPHIIDPRTAHPVEGKLAAWACAPDAATADALSTAFMVMTPDEVEQYCLRHSDTPAVIAVQDQGKDAKEQKVLRFGPWKESIS